MADRLDSCADYLSRCRRSLAGEIADDRFYFTDKAHELLAAAERLVDGCINAEHWLSACGEEFEADDDSGLLVECALPAGHDGDHEEHPRTTVAEQGYRDGLCLRGSAQRLSGMQASLPWHAVQPDRSAEDTAETLREISGEIRTIHVLARRLDGAAADLRREARP